MKQGKRKKLEAAGWSVGSADDFLKLSPEESRQVVERTFSQLSTMPHDEVREAARVFAATRPDGLRVPEGWTIEDLPRTPHYALITTPPPARYMATVDFRLRGFRSGYSISGRLFGEEWNKPRKKYVGRGWKQAIVDDAVAHLAEVLK